MGCFLYALHPRVHQVVEDAVHAQAPGRVGEDEAVHLAVERVSLRAVGHGLRLPVQEVELRQAQAGLVGLPGVGPVEELQEVLRVGIVGDPGRPGHLELADPLVVQQVHELHGARAHAHADGRRRLHPQLGELAVGLAAGVVLVVDLEGAPVGKLPPAVAVAVEVAVDVQQRLGPRGVVVLLGRPEGGVVAHHARGHGALGGDRLPLAHDEDLLAAVVGHHHRAPQRHLLRPVAADDGILHVEHVVGDLRLLLAEHQHALARERRGQPAVGQHLVDEIRGGLVEQVVLAVHEGEEARLLLLDGIDLDAVQQRKPLAVQGVDGAAVPLVGRVRVARVQLVAAVVGVPLQHDLGAAHPVLEHEGAGAHRVRHRVVAVGLDHLARHGHHVGHREDVEEVEVRLDELQADRVAVPHFQARDLRVVVEAAGLLRRGRQLVQARDLVLEEPLVGARVARVAEALDRVLDVLRHELALVSLEGRVVGEEDPGADAEGVAGAALLGLGDGLGGERDEADRAREVVVGEERLEEVLADPHGVAVEDALRIEPRLRRPEGDPQHLALHGRRGRAGGHEGAGEAGGDEGGGTGQAGLRGRANRRIIEEKPPRSPCRHTLAPGQWRYLARSSRSMST